MARPLPSIDELEPLSDRVDGVVTTDLLDDNGHMNVMHYLAWGSRCADRLVRRAGIDDAYRSGRKVGLFTAEHHLTYFDELRLGDEFSVHARMLDRNAKTCHIMTFLVNRSARRISNTLEVLLVHVDLVTRRAAAFPEEVAAAFDTCIASSSALGWAAPTCGAIGVRHRSGADRT